MLAVDMLLRKLRYGVKIILPNGIGLGEEADLTAQKMIVALMFNTAPQLYSSTETAFLPNSCCVSVGFIKQKLKIEARKEIFKNKKERGHYHIVFRVLMNLPSLYKSKKTEPFLLPYVTTYPFRAVAEPPLFIPNEFKLPPKENTPSFFKLSALSIQNRGSTCGRIAKKATTASADAPKMYGNAFIDFMIKFTCKYTKILLMCVLFVFKNFYHRTILEALNPIVHNGYGYTSGFVFHKTCV
jgi:hypothetical protein